MVDDIFRKVKNAFLGTDNAPDEDDRLRPASEDPYGDPADEQDLTSYNSDIRPASEDPYGDPADEQDLTSYNSNIRPASEDPYGDPADEDQNWR